MEFQYALFFEAHDLQENERNKIRRHFQKRRDSGGGECGLVHKVGEKLYRICFKEEEAREKVLQRKIHTVALPCGELRFAVLRESLNTTTTTTSSASTETGAASSSRTQMQATPPPAKSLNASDRLEKTFPMDIYMLYYLRDCPTALAIFQKQFSDIGSILELDFINEKVTVRGDTEKGLSGMFSVNPDKWELQVDHVLSLFQETFICYHVVDPRQVDIILQNSGFADEYVKVYVELGYVVVVGKQSIVKGKIQHLERNLPKKTELAIDEGQYMLTGDEFTRELRANMPSVKVVKNNNALVLEGLEAELLQSLAIYENSVKRIKQKQVKLQKDVQNFFTTSGAIAKYQKHFQQSLRNPVSLKASDSDLVLSSLSPDALEEAEAILNRDFSFKTVQVRGNAAVPPDLDRIREIVVKGKVHANVSERRIDVCLIPQIDGSVNVQLVGCSEPVTQLKEELCDYLLNHVTVQEVLSLPSVEMVDNFSQILSLMSPKDSKVSLKASAIPFPCVQLSGPQHLVKKTKQELSTELSNLTSNTLVFDGPGARQFFSAEGKPSKELIERSNQVFIQDLSEGEMEKLVLVPCPEPEPCPVAVTPDRRYSTESKMSQTDEGGEADGAMSLGTINLEIKLSCLLDEQVNVLVIPMLKKNLSSTRIGKSLAKKGGLKIRFKFNSSKKGSLLPGDVKELVAPACLGCSKLFFIECLPWDGLEGKSEKALHAGLQRCLELCERHGYSSVALPVIGPGKALQYPYREAVQVLTESLKKFASKTTSSTVKTIRIIIKPDEDQSEENYKEVHRQLTQAMNERQANFRSVCSDLDDLSITLGQVQLQLVFGDITNERTQAVVNSTNFENFDYNGVCRDILDVAGPEVEAELKSAIVDKNEVLVTQPGQFPCRGLLHIWGRGDMALVEVLVGSIIQYCEVYEWTSVAMPAICTGIGGLDPGVVAGAIFRGLREALSVPLLSLTIVRIVLKNIDTFLAFKEEATQMFSPALIQRVTPSPPVCPPIPPPDPPVSPPLPPPPPPPRRRISIPNPTPSNQQSVFKITGLSPNNISEAMKTMKEMYQSSCSSQTFKEEELSTLTQEDLFTLKKKVESLGLQVQCNHGDWTVCGPMAKVNQVIHLAHSFMYGTLTREVRIKEEDDLFGRVAWCIQGTGGRWERLPKAANYRLENMDTAAGVEDAQGQRWHVNLQNMEATKQLSTQKATLKRLQNLPDFTFPLYWDNMASEEILKVVPVLPSSAEYRMVIEGFQVTCNKSVAKIERVQNIHLRRSYEARLKHISDKNKLIGGAKERLLYHGTTQDNSQSIINTGFNSRFCGQNATSFGHGTYFAINASYSANPTYSKPAPDGTQLMFVARVLTGLHTKGQKEMKVPPPRDPLQPIDRYDSVVDNLERPNMYVVFHDNQAYPDYLITFRSS